MHVGAGQCDVANHRVRLVHCGVHLVAIMRLPLLVVSRLCG
jgi:hypothetical protein